MVVKLLFAVLVITQAMQTVVQAQGADPKACADTSGGSPSQNLSDKLDRSNGVICPPNVDSGINAPTPQAGKTPVIPPPGSPGGDPHLQPK